MQVDDAPASTIGKAAAMPRHPIGGETRRTLLTGLAALVAWPLAARAQPQGGIRRLGVLMGFRADDAEGQAYAAALVQGLGALDWHDGGNLRTDWRWAGSNPALF